MELRNSDTCCEYDMFECVGGHEGGVGYVVDVEDVEDVEEIVDIEVVKTSRRSREARGSKIATRSGEVVGGEKSNSR